MNRKILSLILAVYMVISMVGINSMVSFGEEGYDSATYKVTYSVIGGNGALRALLEDITPIPNDSMIEQDKWVYFRAEPAVGYEIKEWKKNGEIIYSIPVVEIAVKIYETTNITVEFEPVTEITGFDLIADISAGTEGSAIYADAAAVITVLPTSVTANMGAVSVPVTNWVDIDNYNPDAAGSYTFMALLGQIPKGFANSGEHIARVEVIVESLTSILINPSGLNSQRLDGINKYLVNGKASETGTLNGSSCTAKFDSSTGTLTLYNYNDGDIFVDGIDPVDLKIILFGHSTITKGGLTQSTGIWNQTGGNINITSKSEDNSLKIDVSTTANNTGAYGIATDISGIKPGDVNISGKAKVMVNVSGPIAKSLSLYGLYVRQDFNISNDAWLKVTVTGEQTVGVYTGGNFAINTSKDVSVESISTGLRNYALLITKKINLYRAETLTLKATNNLTNYKDIIYEPSNYQVTEDLISQPKSAKYERVGGPVDISLVRGYIIWSPFPQNEDIILTAKQNGSIIDTVRSEPDGMFEIILPAGSYDFELTKSGYLKRTIPDVNLGVGDIINLGNSYNPMTLLAGDVNGDGKVNATDLSQLLVAFNKTYDNIGYNPAADFNGDGFINATDLSKLLENFNKTSSGYDTVEIGDTLRVVNIY